MSSDSKQRDPHPHDVQGRLFSYLCTLLTAFGRAMPGPVTKAGGALGQFLRSLMFTISPAVPVDLGRLMVSHSIRHLVFSAFIAGLFFSLLLTAGFTLIDGTFSGSDPARLYFSQDKWNISLYIFVTPTYIALSVWMMVLTIRHWSEIAEFRGSLGGKEQHPRRLGLALVIGFGLCAMAITNYVTDALDPEKTELLYWFANEINGVRVLNRTGYYYLVLNFGFLFLTLLAVAAFFTLCVEVFRVGRLLGKGVAIEFEKLRMQLETFTTAYLIAKLLAAIYMVNAFIWKASPLGSSSNILVAGLALTIIGVFFISIPRMYIELKWFQLASLTTDEDTEGLYKDIRPVHVRMWAHVLDVFIIGGFIGKWWELDTKFMGAMAAIGF